MNTNENDKMTPEEKQAMFNECLADMKNVAKACNVPDAKAQEVALEGMSIIGSIQDKFLIGMGAKFDSMAFMAIYCAGFNHGTGDLLAHRTANNRTVGDLPDFNKMEDKT